MTKVFQPIGNFDQIYEFENIKNNIVDFNKISDNKIETSVLFEEIDKRKKDFEARYQEILDYISRYWGKYIHIRFLYNANYTETRNKEPQWNVYYEANVMLYRYVPENNSLFGLFCKLNDIHQGGIVDKSINLFALVQEDAFEIEEITEDEFLSTAHNTVINCLISRCDKIESGDYILTKHGYENKH